jgi:Lrp/AsnC family leucine-responsive transcriptional regulator
MRELDDIDRKILHLLVADARRPYSEIADHVGLSPPAVSDRVERLVDAGIITQFTLDVDRSKLADGVRVLVHLTPEPDAVESVRDGLFALDVVENVFVTAAGTVYANAYVPQGDVRAVLDSAVDMDRVRDLDVTLLADAEWSTTVGATGGTRTCEECGDPVAADSVSTRIDGEVHYFCSTTCRSAFSDHAERVSSNTH